MRSNDKATLSLDWILEESSQNFFANVNSIIESLAEKPFNLSQREADQILEEYPPIIIIGPPRSGSTVISQILANAFQVGCVNNFIAKFWMRPALGAYLANELGIGVESGFSSKFGRTTSIEGLHEFSFFWQRFFDFSKTHHCESIRPELAADLSMEIASLTRQFCAPILLKYCFGSVQIPALSRALPTARFVILKRDPFFTAQSLLLARKRLMGSIDQWWSLKPENFDTLLQLDPIEQVVAQIYYTYSQIEKHRKQNGSTFIEIEYENIGSDNTSFLEDISSRLSLDYRKDWRSSTLHDLSPNVKIYLNQEEVDLLKLKVKKYFN